MPDSNKKEGLTGLGWWPLTVAFCLSRLLSWHLTWSEWRANIISPVETTSPIIVSEENSVNCQESQVLSCSALDKGGTCIWRLIVSS